MSFVTAPPAVASAQSLLLAIAQRARPNASDQQPGTGSCLHLTRRDRNPGRRSIETTSIRQINADGSGLLWQQRTSHGDPVPPLTLYGPGELRSPISEPIPTDPARLADAVTAVTPPGSGSTAVVAVLLDLISVRILGLAQRAAAVRLLAMLPGVELVGWYEFRFSDGSSDPIDVYLDPDTAEILGYRLGGFTDLQPSTTTRILRRTRCECPPPPRTTFVGAALRTNLPRSASCTIPPGGPAFYPADTSQGPRR